MRGSSFRLGQRERSLDGPNILTALREALEARRTVLIRGPGGIGKTQLLLNALPSAKSERRVVWLDLEKYGTTEGLITALAVMLREQAGTDTLDIAGDASRCATRLVSFWTARSISLDRTLDELDDLLADLSNRTLKAPSSLLRRKLTCSVRYSTRRLVLLGLEVEPSRQLLRSLVQGGASLDRESEAALLAFSEGHPLHAPLGRGNLNRLSRVGTSC